MRAAFRAGLVLAAVAVPLAGRAQTPPQDPTPQNVMQQFIVMTIVASQCKPPPLPPEKDAAMEAMGKKMQAKANVSDADMMQDFQRLSTQIITPDCETWNAALPGQVDALLALADKVP